MDTLIVVFASLLLVFGICWNLLIHRVGFWFARKMGDELKARAFLTTPAGKVALWVIRMSAFLYIFLGLFLLLTLFAPDLVDKVPFYVIAVLIMLPIIIRSILMRIALRIVRKQTIKDKPE